MDSKIETTVTGGQVQGIIGATKVFVANLTINNPPVSNSNADPHGSTGKRPSPCPYPGLAYFGPGDAELFFGRDLAIDRLAKVLRRHSLTALVGASGSGKSSVVLAGLVPHLHRVGDWRFSHFRIGTELERNPFLALARALTPLYVANDSDTERLKNTKQLAIHLQMGSLTLRDVFADCRSRNKHARILLIADQFEELFTLIEDEAVQHRFMDVLLAGFPNTAPRGRPDMCLILTLRGDFYGQALRYRPFADALQDHTENLGPMNREELRAAIVLPAENANVSFEPGLVETLLDNVESKPGSLPLLQFALREMWGRLDSNKITRKNYDEIGGVQGALAQRAETIFAIQTENGTQQEMENRFRRLFTRLVTLGEGQEDTRRVVERQELGEVVWSLAQHLADEENRLVVTNAQTLASETAEVVHEALIRHWPRLVRWINGDRAFQSWLRQIKPNVELWSANPEDEAPLLRGSMLAQARDGLATRHDDLSLAEQGFINASLTLQERYSGERMLVEGWMRLLDLEDLKDQAKIDFAQMNKLRVFVDYIPIPGFPSWKKLTALYGEAIGIEETIVSKEINDREASVRFEGGLKTSSNRPRILRKLSERGTVVITSTGISEKAYAVKELGGSVFGHYFNEALAGRAANAAGIVTAYSAFDYVQEHMRDAFKQSPSFQSHGTNMVDFPLTGGNPSLQSGGKRRALLLATDTYLDQNIPSLFGGQTQLWRTAELLRTSGAFAVSLLVGDQMTRTNLTSELIRLSDEAGPDDCLLFYFAGHANIVDDNMYLIFSDSRLGEPLSYLSTIELNNSLQRSGNASLIVVLDTSYAGSAVAAFE